MSADTHLRQWKEATADLASQIYEDEFTSALEELRAEAVDSGKRTDEQEPTDGMRMTAGNRASAMVVQTLYRMPEYKGVKNPTWDDPEWGYPATRAANEDEGWTPSAAAQAPTADNPAGLGEDELLWNWLGQQTWSEFALSLHRQYAQRGSLSPKQWAAARKMKATVDAKQKAREEQAAKQDAESAGLDLSELPSGYYAVPGGDTRLKIKIDQGKPGSKWEGWTFVSDGAEYGSRQKYGSQRPDGTYRGKIEDVLKAVLEDPYAARIAYGKLWGVCGSCGRMLEDEQSVAAGIGPICAGKWEVN